MSAAAMSSTERVDAVLDMLRGKPLMKHEMNAIVAAAKAAGRKSPSTRRNEEMSGRDLNSGITEIEVAIWRGVRPAGWFRSPVGKGGLAPHQKNFMHAARVFFNAEIMTCSEEEKTE